MAPNDPEDELTIWPEEEEIGGLLRYLFFARIGRFLGRRLRFVRLLLLLLLQLLLLSGVTLPAVVGPVVPGPPVDGPLVVTPAVVPFVAIAAFFAALAVTALASLVLKAALFPYVEFSLSASLLLSRVQVREEHYVLPRHLPCGGIGPIPQ